MNCQYSYPGIHTHFKSVKREKFHTVIPGWRRQEKNDFHGSNRLTIHLFHSIERLVPSTLEH